MNRKLVLALLLAVLALSLFYGISNAPRQERVVAAGGRAPLRSAAGGEGEPAAPPHEELRVRLEVLQRQRESFPGIRRNLFGPLVTVVPLPPPPPPVLPPPTVAPIPPPPEPPLAERVLQQELARFVYLGFLEKGGEKSVFLSAGNEIFVVKRGDRFGGTRQFLVRDLAADRLIIQQGDDPRPIVLSLAEKAPLASASPVPAGNPRFRSPERSRIASVPPPPPPTIEPMDSEPVGEPEVAGEGERGETNEGGRPD